MHICSTEAKGPEVWVINIPSFPNLVFQIRVYISQDRRDDPEDVK